MPNPTASWDLIDRYLAGEATPVEVTCVEHALRDAPAVRVVLDAYRLALDPELEVAVPKVEQSLRRWRAQREVAARETAPRAKQRPRLRAVLTWGICATLAVMAGWGITTAVRPSAPSSEHRYITRAAQRATITLIDGTKVVLAPQTTFVVTSHFGTKTRTVSLSGEAYFDVKSSVGAPFIVRTGSVAARVLGTTFTIRHYASAEPVQIAVQSGKVVASGRGTSTIVSAGTVVVVTDSTATAVAVSDLSQYTDWTQGRLVFEKTPVPVLLATVGRWYGYQFRLADSTLALDRISVVLKTTDLSDMLTSLKSVLDVTMVFDGSVITLTPRRALPRRPIRRTVKFSPSMEMGR